MAHSDKVAGYSQESDVGTHVDDRDTYDPYVEEAFPNECQDCGGDIVWYSGSFMFPCRCKVACV